MAACQVASTLPEGNGKNQGRCWESNLRTLCYEHSVCQHFSADSPWFEHRYRLLWRVERLRGEQEAINPPGLRTGLRPPPLTGSFLST